MRYENNLKNEDWGLEKFDYIKNTTNRSINKIFSEHITQPIDRKLLAKILDYVERFERKNEEHINFLGSNLLGVYSFKFLPDDRATWIEDILEIKDYDKLQSDIWDLPDVDRSWNIASSALNLSFLYMTYRALTTPLLNETDKERLAITIMNMLQYKFISSIHTRYFPHKANENIAMALYEKLDNKSQLKRYGTWKGLITARTLDILGHDSLHHTIIRTLEPDIKLIAMLGDIWTRLKSIFNILTKMFMEIKDTHGRIVTTSKFTMIEGEAVLKDHINKFNHIVNIMQDTVPDRNAFVKEDLIAVIPQVLNTVYPTYLRETLLFISENYSNKKINIPKLIDDILQFVLNIIHKDNIAIDSIPQIAIKLKGALRSSRLISPEYITIKQEVDLIVEAANPRIPESSITSTRIGIVLYVALRALLAK